MSTPTFPNDPYGQPLPEPKPEPSDPQVPLPSEPEPQPAYVPTMTPFEPPTREPDHNDTY